MHAYTEAAAAEKQSFVLLSAVIATLERRRAAGTLVAGTCRRWPEEEWYGKFVQHRELLNKRPPYTPKRQAMLAQFVGYDAYIYATAASLEALERQPKASSPEAQALAVCAPFAVRGIDLLEQPRLKIWNDSSLASEDMLANIMQLFSETYGPVLAEFGDIQPPESIRPMMAVLSRWQRCVRSGMLQKRDLAAGAVYAAGVTSALHAASMARMAAATLKCCSLQSCATRELHPGHYKQCGACKTVVYCCREHQVADWPDHKAACKAARKAAAEGQ